MIGMTVCDFQREIIFFYDEEQYSVRDNGTVLRHSRTGKRPRPTDNQWTFGKPNSQNGYMYISQVRIHRIVATAFHGTPPTPEHVVDHIDTNRRNNRPENLRWLTRLENALLNPITVKRIEFICGNIEAFLEDPSRLRHSSFESNLGWMRTVTAQEAQACRERMHLWAKSDKPPSGHGSLGEWVFKPIVIPNPSPKAAGEIPRYLVMAKTSGAAQRRWHTPTEFPNLPEEIEKEPIAAYEKKLTVGAVFACNSFSKSVVLRSAITDDGQSLLVMCENAIPGAIKPWSLAKVTYEDDLYIHTNIRTFFTPDGAEKEFCLAQRLEWVGGDVFDDFC